MKNRVRPWVRMFAAEADAGEGANTGQGSAPSQPASQEPAGAEGQEGGVDKPAESAPDEDGDDNPDGRGSKRAVLKDLASERDKRQAAEAARDELQERLDAIDREKMTELERAQSDLEKANTRIAELEEAATAHAREQLVGKVLSDAKLPAEMADRLRGETEFRKRSVILEKEDPAGRAQRPGGVHPIPNPFHPSGAKGDHSFPSPYYLE